MTRGWSLAYFTAAAVLLAVAYSVAPHVFEPAWAWGQMPQTPISVPPIRVGVNLVSTPVVVQDVTDSLVVDLTQSDFRLFDNGIQQTLEAVEIGGAPVAAVIVVETSSRIAALLPAICRTGLLFTQNVIGETGEAAVIGYSDKVDTLVSFTQDHDVVESAFANLQPHGSDAYLYDALQQAVRSLRNLPPPHRRVIITVAEAIDTGSEEKPSVVVREAQNADITIYSIGLSTTAAEARGPQKQAAPLPVTPPGTFSLPPLPGLVNGSTVQQLQHGNMDLGALFRHTWSFLSSQPAVEAAAAATGGLYQSTLSNDSIERAIGRIADELHSQYTLSYLPHTKNSKSGFHQIKVTVGQPDLFKVRSRPGYYARLPQ